MPTGYDPHWPMRRHCLHSVAIYAMACHVESGSITTSLTSHLSHLFCCFILLAFKLFQIVETSLPLPRYRLPAPTHTHLSTCAIRSSNVIRSADAYTTNTQSIHAPLMVNEDMPFRKRRCLLATLAVLIATIDLKPTIPASCRTLVTEAVDILRHTYDE